MFLNLNKRIDSSSGESNFPMFIILIIITSTTVIGISSLVSYNIFKIIKKRNYYKALSENKKELIELDISAQKKLRDRLFTKNTVNLLNEIVEKSKNLEIIGFYNSALNDLEFCKSMGIYKKKDSLISLYNYAQVKLENQQFSQETIDLLNEVIQESEKIDFKELYNNAINSLDFCKSMINQKKPSL